MMKLREIIELAKDGGKPEYADLLYAVLALSALHAFDRQDMLKVYSETDDKKMFGLKWRAEESFKRSKKAMEVSPKDYVGWSHDPNNPEYQKQRKVAGQLFNKIFGDKE